MYRTLGALALSLLASSAFADDIKVMVIDTGIGHHKDLDGIVQYDPSDDYKDSHGHGTHVAGIVAYGNKRQIPMEMPHGRKPFTQDEKVCPQVKIYSCKYYVPDGNGLDREIKCIKKATALKMDYINFSGGGTDFSDGEYLAFKAFLDQGGSVFAAAGNEKADLSEKSYYPASYSLEDGFTDFQKKMVKKDGSKTYIPLRIYAVRNVDSSGKNSKLSNWHTLTYQEHGEDIYSTLPDDSYGLMTGTSQATPALLHTILMQRCKKIDHKN